MVTFCLVFKRCSLNWVVELSLHASHACRSEFVSCHASSAAFIKSFLHLTFPFLPFCLPQFCCTQVSKDHICVVSEASVWVVLPNLFHNLFPPFHHCPLSEPSWKWHALQPTGDYREWTWWQRFESWEIISKLCVFSHHCVGKTCNKIAIYDFLGAVKWVSWNKLL